MRARHTTILAGCAALAIAGLYEHATAGSVLPQQAHVLTFQLPDGEVEQISYSGNVAPGISISPVPAPFAAFTSDVPAVEQAPFADFDRIEAQMDQQINDMMKQNQLLAAQPFLGLDGTSGQLTQAALGKLPAGTSSYLMVSTLSPKGECTRTVQISAPTGGGVQNVVSKSSGDCSGEPALTVAAPAVQSAPTRGANTL